MSSKVSRRSVPLRLDRVRGTLLLLVSCAVLCLAAASLEAQDPDPNNWDLKLRTDKETKYRQGDPLQCIAGIVSRKDNPGVQGWSFGVQHDPNVLEIQSVSSGSQGEPGVDSDVPSVFKGGFDQTTIVEDKDKVKIGYFQAMVLSFMAPAEVPVSDFFRVADARYKVKDNACTGKAGDFKTKVEFTDQLSLNPGGPKVDINLTIGGKGIDTMKIVSAEPTIECIPLVVNKLSLKFDKAVTELVADKVATYNLKILFEAGEQAQDIQGWSYGVTMDTADLEAMSGEPGVDSKALNGGAGPDFSNYTLNDQNVAGTLRGVTVGVVVAMDPPATEVLKIPASGKKFIDTIKLRTKITIPQGGASKTTVIRFSDQLGGDRPVEVLATIQGDSVVPDFTDTLTLTLIAPGGGPRFIRGDANNDARVDISDGVWIISELFYGGPATVCKAAADANADKKIDLTDAVYIINYQLQPGRLPGNLYPAPPAPFPSCGTAANVTTDDCPMGSTTCM